MNTETKSTTFADRVYGVPRSFIREILKVAVNPNIISFAGGLPNPAFFPVTEMDRCAERVFREHGRQALQYAETEGYYPLRKYIAERYLHLHGLHIEPEQILITNGSQQALDLLGKLFINPGDQVLLERPSYLGALQCLSVFQPRFLEVDLQQDGIDINELEMILHEYPVRLFYSIPNFQNPTGITYSAEKRLKTCRLISQYHTHIIEDDPYGDIRFASEKLPSLYSLLPEQTIWLGSFSKTISPGLRLGWMVASTEIIQQATIMKQAADLHSGNLTQYILYEFLKSYDVEDHIGKIRNAYRKQRDVMTDCLKNYFPSSVTWTQPEGGMFIWISLPEGITSREFLEKAVAMDILFVPGDAFYAGKTDTQTLRLNFSNVEETDMRTAMKKLGAILQDY